MAKPRRKTARIKYNDVDYHFENVYEHHVNFKERIVYIHDDVDDVSADLFKKAICISTKFSDSPNILPKLMIPFSSIFEK